jgi:hypothetical protein
MGYCVASLLQNYRSEEHRQKKMRSIDFNIWSNAPKPWNKNNYHHMQSQQSTKLMEIEIYR